MNDLSRWIRVLAAKGWKKGDQSTYLIMKSRLRQAFLHRLVLVKHMPQVLYRGRDDAASARGADDEVKRAVVEIFDDGRGDGRERPFARFDEVGRRGRVAEGVGLVGDGEVVHLVVHDDARLGHDELAAEEQVYGRGERDGHARGICRDDVGGAVPGRYAFGY